MKYAQYIEEAIATGMYLYTENKLAGAARKFRQIADAIDREHNQQKDDQVEKAALRALDRQKQQR